MKIGFDLDGVLCSVDVGLLRLIDNMSKEVRKSAEEWYYRERKPQLNPLLFLAPTDICYIITSRPSRLNHITYPWIARYYPNAKFVQVNHESLKENNQEAIDEWLKQKAKKKAEIINKFELDVYFEDSMNTASWLRKYCPNTKIIQYGGRW